jgi:hypothetical protein
MGAKEFGQMENLWSQNAPLMKSIETGDLALQKQEASFSKEQQDQYTNTYMPLEKTYATQAQNWASPTQLAQNVGEAEGAVNSQSDAGRNASMQQLESYGVDPTSTRYAALDIGSRTQQAASAAAAGTGAFQQTKLQQLGLEQGAINTGLGVASGANSSVGTATGAGAGGARSLAALEQRPAHLRRRRGCTMLARTTWASMLTP